MNGLGWSTVDFKQNPEVGWNMLLGLSLGAILLGGVFGLVLHPDTAPLRLRSEAKRQQAEDIVAADQRRSEALSVTISDRTWPTLATRFGSAALNHVTQLAADSGVQVTGFRTGIEKQSEVLTTEPYVLELEGSFPHVMSLVHRLESPESKLAIQLLELSASDAGVDRVNATVGLLGYVADSQKLLRPVSSSGGKQK